MMEIKIYFKGRFMVNREPKYYPAFWGFITNVEENYSGGVYKINLTCADILHWWAYSSLNVHPVPESNIAAGGGQTLTVFSTVFNRKNPYQIIYTLTTNMGMHEFVTPTWLAQKTPLSTIYPPNQFKEHAIGPNGIMSYWQKRLGNMTNLLKMYGMDGKRVDYNGVQVIRPTNTVPDKSQKSQIKQGTESKDNKELKIMPKFIKEFETFADYEDLGDFDNAEYMTKLQIATEVKNKIDFEFFQDVDGNWIFKPPFYNLNVRGIQPYTVLPTDVLSYSINTDTEGIITVLTVYTPMNKNLRTTTFAKGVGFHMDIDLSKRFGIRHQAITLEYVNDATLARSLALGQMNIMNAKVTTGSVTIPGRPEMRLGYPIYLEHRDSFHYVRSINHSFDYGGSFTTTLSLQSERRKVWYENEKKEWVPHIDKVYRLKTEKKPAETDKPDKVKSKPLTKQQKLKLKEEEAAKKRRTFGYHEVPPPSIQVTNKVEYDQMKLYEGQRRIISMAQGKYELSPRNTAPLAQEEKIVTRTTAPYTDKQGYQVFGSFPYGRNLNPILIAPDINGNVINTNLPVLKEVYLTTMARPLFDHESRSMNILLSDNWEGAVPSYLNTEGGMPEILGMMADTTSADRLDMASDFNVNLKTSPFTVVKDLDTKQNKSIVEQNKSDPQKNAEITFQVVGATAQHDCISSVNSGKLVNSVGQNTELKLTGNLDDLNKGLNG